MIKGRKINTGKRLWQQESWKQENTSSFCCCAFCSKSVSDSPGCSPAAIANLTSFSQPITSSVSFIAFECAMALPSINLLPSPVLEFAKAFLFGDKSFGATIPWHVAWAERGSDSFAITAAGDGTFSTGCGDWSLDNPAQLLPTILNFSPAQPPLLCHNHSPLLKWSYFISMEFKVRAQLRFTSPFLSKRYLSA